MSKRCSDCGMEYEGTFKLDGQELNLCEGCFEDYVCPSVCFEGWED